MGFLNKAYVPSTKKTGSALFAYFSDFAILQLPTIVVDGSDSVCIGQSLHFTSNTFSNATYQWKGPNGNIGNPNNTPEIIIPNAKLEDNGWYTLTGNVGACPIPFQSDSIYALIKSSLELEFTVADNCPGAPAVVENQSENFGKMSYTWNFGDNTPNVNGVNPTHIYTNLGTYTVKLWAESTKGCKDSISRSVNIIGMITGRDTATFCAGESYDWNGRILTVAGDYVDTIKKSGICDSIIYFRLNTLDTLQTFIKDTVCYGDIYEKNNFKLPAQFKSDTHRLTLQSHYKCDSTVILDLTVLPELKVNLPPHKTICKTDFKPYTISANIGNYDYKWSTGAITSGITINETSSGDYTYTVTITNSLNCQTTGEHTLTIQQNPTKVEIISHTDDFCDNNVATLAVETDGTSIRWSTGATTPTIDVYSPGTYTVFSSIDNCEISGSYTIEECQCPPIFIPNVFTPNNDGFNDTFLPDIFCELNNFSMYIYNRWGKLVYASDSYHPWDGKYNGKDVAVGVYYYVILYSTVKDPSNEIKIHGTVTLVR